MFNNLEHLSKANKGQKRKSLRVKCFFVLFFSSAVCVFQPNGQLLKVQSVVLFQKLPFASDFTKSKCPLSISLL